MGRDNALGVASVKAPQPLDALGAQPLFTETGQQSPADHLYYSFTTLTTTGYGGLTTESDVGRAAFDSRGVVGPDLPGDGCRGDRRQSAATTMMRLDSKQRPPCPADSRRRRCVPERPPRPRVPIVHRRGRFGLGGLEPPEAGRYPVSTRLPASSHSFSSRRLKGRSRAVHVAGDRTGDPRPELTRKVVRHAVDQHQLRPADRARRRPAARDPDEGVVGPVDDKGRRLDPRERSGPIPDAITAPSCRIVPASSKPRSKLARASERSAGSSVANPGEAIAFPTLTRRSS